MCAEICTYFYVIFARPVCFEGGTRANTTKATLGCRLHPLAKQEKTTGKVIDKETQTRPKRTAIDPPCHTAVRPCSTRMCIHT